ncbi:MAG: hypothetical protein QXO55_07715 [Candidatus Korarchaeum sp.]
MRIGSFLWVILISLIISSILTAAPLYYVDSQAGRVISDVMMEAKHPLSAEEKVIVFTLSGSERFINIGKVDPRIRDEFRLPDIILLASENRTEVNVTVSGKWNMAAPVEVSRLELIFDNGSILSWSSGELYMTKSKTLTLKLVNWSIGVSFPYPRIILRAFKGKEPIHLEDERPMVGYLGGEDIGKIKVVQDAILEYYKYFRGGGSWLLRNFTDMLPGILIQDLVLNTDFRSSRDIGEAKRDYFVKKVRECLSKGRRGLDELTDFQLDLFYSTTLSWFANFFTISMALGTGIWLVRREQRRGY